MTVPIYGSVLDCTMRRREAIRGGEASDNSDLRIGSGLCHASAVAWGLGLAVDVTSIGDGAQPATLSTSLSLLLLRFSGSLAAHLQG